MSLCPGHPFCVIRVICGRNSSPSQIQRRGKLRVYLSLRGCYWPGGVSESEKPRYTPRLRFVRVYCKSFIGTSTGVRNMVCAPSNRPAGRDVNNVEHKRRVHRNRGMKATRWLPRAIAHAADKFAVRAGWMERQSAAVAGDRKPFVHERTNS